MPVRYARRLRIGEFRGLARISASEAEIRLFDSARQNTVQHVRETRRSDGATAKELAGCQKVNRATTRRVQIDQLDPP